MIPYEELLDLGKQHEELDTRATSLADNPDLSPTQHELATAWRSHIRLFRERAISRVSIAFVAAVGVGKSALISAATGLTLESADRAKPKQWSVLPVGDGRTTLGEITVVPEGRQDIHLEVEPLPLADLKMELEIFAKARFAWGHRRGAQWGAVESESNHPGQELYLLFRNWLDPSRTIAEAAETDKVDEEAAAASSVDALVQNWFGRIDWEKRTQRFEREFANDANGLAALKETLGKLMAGTLDEAPVPLRTTIRLPFAGLVRIVDTRGIDGEHPEHRADIQALIADPDTLFVVCSRFAGAPEESSRRLLRSIQEKRKELRLTLGVKPQLCVVDNREREGGAAETRKRNDCLRICKEWLQQENLEAEVFAIDVREPEEANALQEELRRMADEAYAFRYAAWKKALEDAQRALDSFGDTDFEARVGEFELRLWWAWDAWIAKWRASRKAPVHPLRALVDFLREQKPFHHSQLNATILRRGRYYALDLARIAAGSASSSFCGEYFFASGAVDSTAEALSGSIEDARIKQHIEMRAAEFGASAVAYGDELIAHLIKQLQAYFQSDRATEMWEWCADQWGEGPGYTEKVLSRIEEEQKNVSVALGGIALPEARLPKRPPLFSLRKLRLKNFRCVEAQTIELGNTTVFIGNNGQGKTAWLEAIVKAVGAFLPGVGADPAPSLAEADIREACKMMGDVPDRQRQLPLEIEADAMIEGYPLRWKRFIDSLPLSAVSNEDDALQVKARKCGEEIRSHDVRQLPVLAYYGTQRLWPPALQAKEELGDTRLDGYRDCLNAASTHEHMLSWMKKFTFVELQTKKQVAPLRAIQRTVLACVEGAREFYYDVALGQLVLVMPNGERPTFGMLSDGYRNMVAMVADIAWRASVLNPHVGDRAPELAEGVVLIDEVDLHLHPKWQRHVLHDLRRAFPRLQFVATTHSPFIVQSLDPGQLYDLDRNIASGPEGNESPEDIVEKYMGVTLPQRSERRAREYDIAKKYYELLDKIPAADTVELANLKAKLDEMLAPYSDNQALVAFLEIKRMRAEGQRT